MSDTEVGALVVVVWLDATFEMDKAPAAALAETVGWIVSQDDDCIVIASERFDDASYRAYTCVPWISVGEVRQIDTY